MRRLSALVTRGDPSYPASVVGSSSPVSVPVVVGRSSSHFTRVVRLFAHEFGVSCELRIVHDLLSTDPADYGGNPGLKLPNLVTSEGVVFGSLNCCRALAELAPKPIAMIWPEQVRSLVAANVQELTLQAMTTEVTWILTNASTGPTGAYANKLLRGLVSTLDWLDVHVDAALGELPIRRVSYLELALFCLLEHLEFRRVVDVQRYVNLRRFRDKWGQRESAGATAFAYDAPR